MCEGIAEELRRINLKDKRLDKRSIKLIEALAVDPTASINASCGDWNETLAAYRFFNNELVSPEKILCPHQEATLGRMQEQPVVLIVQDTTELDYTEHPPKDARCLNKENRFGVYDHVSLAVTPDRLCLGVVGVETFDRSPESIGKLIDHKQRPIEEKESYRWLQGYRLACELAAKCPGSQIVSVADRECDIYEIYAEYRDRQSVRAEYVIRAQREARVTLELDPSAGKKAYRKVYQTVADSPLLATRIVELPAIPGRAARDACLEIRALSVTMKAPADQPELLPVTHNVVLVQEVGGPGDDTEVDWLLFTTLPIDSADAAEKVKKVEKIIDYYRARWTIEIYFRTLKSGCCVEKIQLETVPRLKRCLAFYRIIAWRILHLTYLNRTSPDLPCTAMFADCEWKSVYRVVTKKAVPKTPPSLSEFIRILAQLGGYNNRPGEPPPGPQVLWVSMRRMTDFACAWLSFGPETRKSCV